MAYSPWIYETTPEGEERYDIWARLLKDRIIFIGYPLITPVANLIIAQLLYLEAEDADKAITMYLNCAPSSPVNGLAVFDAMRHVRCDIETLLVGRVSTMGALLLAGGTKGRRSALPNASISLAQPYGGVANTASDIQLSADEIRRVRRDIETLLAACTGQPVEKIRNDIDHQFPLTSAEALTYGLIDQIVDNKEALHARGTQ